MLKQICQVVAIGSVLIGVSCGTPQGGQSSRDAVPTNAVGVGTSSNGGHVSLDVGQVLYVELPENPSRGLTWQLASPLDQMVMMPDGQRFIESNKQQSEGSLVGTQQLRFAATGVGETVVHLELVRPGAGTGSSAERWIVQVIVR
jgi:predicted secreted protein